MRIAFCLLVLTFSISTFAADPAERWEPTIQRFEKADQKQMPPKGGILFVGSSSIVKWDTDKWFSGWDVINRGFGGSEVSDVNHYLDRIVLKYAPKIIVFYAGDNDVAHGESAEQVFEDFKAFLAAVRKKLPETQVIYLPIKPSISRWDKWPTMKRANAMIEQYMKTRPNWHYVDTATPMLGKDGRPRPELFIGDGLHLNAQGYKLWTVLVKPYLASKNLPDRDEK